MAPVRFDERGGETEHGLRLFGTGDAKGPATESPWPKLCAPPRLYNYQMGFPLPGDWFEVLNGDASVYGGQNHGNAGKITANGPARDGLAQSASILIPRMGVIVFARKPLTPEPEPGFVRGNCNGDRTVDISDAIQTLGILFLGASTGDCYAACDANADQRVDISDGIFTLTFLFGGGPPPPAPYPVCGPNSGALECAAACEGAS